MSLLSLASRLIRDGVTVPLDLAVRLVEAGYDLERLPQAVGASPARPRPASDRRLGRDGRRSPPGLEVCDA